MKKYGTSHNTGNLGLWAFAVWLYFIVSWIINLVKLISCDFEGPWKDEIVHAIGLIGPAAGITVWF
jgi:hypothetical protein